MKVFISHNKADKDIARLLATAIVGQGESVWFDEWDLKPGDSIVGGIEAGLSSCDVIVIVWSHQASLSKWVGAELRAVIRRRVDHDGLRIVPIMVDDTDLPLLVADYLGFELSEPGAIPRIASEIVGAKDISEIARSLQLRLNELADDVLAKDNPVRVVVCPKCASKNLQTETDLNIHPSGPVYFVMCLDCDWGECGKSNSIAERDKIWDH